MKKLGILGGMGPLAGAYFFLRFTELTAALSDASHPEVVLSSTPQIPDRTAYLLGEGRSPLPALVRGIIGLNRSGADIIAIPCNTAHAFLPELQHRSRAPILNMPVLTAGAALAAGAVRVGVLCTSGANRAGVFRAACRAAGLSYMAPDTEEQGEVDELIYRQKGGDKVGQEEYWRFADKLLSAGADAVILGCTEISVACSRFGRPYFLDALEILAKQAVLACVCRCRSEETNHDVWRIDAR